MSTPLAVPLILYELPSLVASALPEVPPTPSVTPLTLPSPTDFTAGGLASVSTAPMPVCAPTTALLTLQGAVGQATVPPTFWSLPSMVTLAAAAAPPGPVTAALL